MASGGLLTSGNDIVRGYVAFALGKISDPEAIPALIEELIRDRSLSQADATSTLLQIGEIDAIAAMGNALNDGDGFARVNAAVALRKIGTSEALKAIEEYEKQKREQ